MVGADVLNCPEIDIAAKGEGENTIVELLNAIDGQGQFDSIQGIIYREDGQIVENAPRQFMDDLDSLPFPHETAPEVLRNYDQYPVTAFRYILATRGCPYNCFFCGSRRIWSRKPRFRSPENVIREIGSLQQKGLRSVHFADDTFGADKQYITDLCNAFMNDCPDMKWSCEIHVKLVDEQTISLMKAAGCHSIDLGIESGNDDILRQMRKQITIEEALAACRIIKKRGIELNTFFMVGFPQETEDTLNDTVTAMKKTKCNQVAYSIFTPYPGTEAFEFCRENGLVDDNYDISLHNHQSPLNSFCMNIPPERFRALVSEVEKMVDRKNALNRIKRVFSLNTIWRIRERGINNSLRTGARIFTGR
jgi:anaerobic magnesium-protoporphyrin IX monomethyl ester cyclase